MNNAQKFREVFGIYATEMWSMTEQQFLEWLNGEYSEERPCLSDETKSSQKRNL